MPADVQNAPAASKASKAPDAAPVMQTKGDAAQKPSPTPAALSPAATIDPADTVPVLLSKPSVQARAATAEQATRVAAQTIGSTVVPNEPSKLRYRHRTDKKRVSIGNEVVAADPDWIPIDAQGRDLRPIMVEGKVMLSGDPKAITDIPTPRLEYMQSATEPLLRAILFGAGLDQIIAANGTPASIVDGELTRNDLYHAVLKLELERERYRRQHEKAA